jgi:hypothetical protein
LNLIPLARRLGVIWQGGDRTLKVTLDNNCIIDLEKDNIYAPYLKKLIELYTGKKIVLRVTAISASEQKPNKAYVNHFNEFEHRLIVIGLSNIEILPTILYVGLGFVGHSLTGGGELEELERKIQRILFPSIELEYGDFCKKRGLELNDRKAWSKWANAKCDVLTLWSHIWHGGDIFITRDSNFHRKAKKLLRLGAGKILRPAEGLRLINQAAS